MQASEDVDLLSARRLDRHLLECHECSQYRKSQLETDRGITFALNAQVANVSVRESVVQSLIVEAAGTTRMRQLRKWPSTRLLRSGVTLIAAAAVAVGAALFAPGLLDRGTSPTPAGAAWHLQRPFIGYPLAVDPSHSGHLLVGAWGEVYQSSNGGAWTQTAPLPGSFRIRALAIDATDSNRFIVATKRSILVSDDGGKSWRVTAQNMLGIENMFLVQNPNNPSTFYSGPSVVWKSVDSGSTWSQSGAGHVFAPDGIQSLAVAPNGNLLTGIWHGGVAISRNDGKTWQRTNRGLAPNVMDVTSASGLLWAATTKGAYISRNKGRSWEQRGPRNFWTTAVLPQRGYVLVGGNGGLYRSVDRGGHWLLSDEGLPLDPYVNSLYADSANSRVIYASLNGDGIYESSNGGVSWNALNQGLPIDLQEHAPNLVLFLRKGAVWSTDSAGSDPGGLTVDNQVRSAALSPDAAAIAYVAQTGKHWSLKVISAGGSAAKTFLSGATDPPTTVLWSPDSSSVAIVRRQNVIISSVGRGKAIYSWSLPSRTNVLGWSRDGLSILVWNRVSGSVTSRLASDGQVELSKAGSYLSRPVRSPDGTQVAYVAGGVLHIGDWGGGPWRVNAAARGCSVLSWSNDARAVLLACGGSAETRSAASGALMGKAVLGSMVAWAPGSHDTLLFFRQGGLWRWSLGSEARQIVPDASPA